MVPSFLEPSFAFRAISLAKKGKLLCAVIVGGEPGTMRRGSSRLLSENLLVVSEAREFTLCLSYGKYWCCCWAWGPFFSPTSFFLFWNIHRASAREMRVRIFDGVLKGDEEFLIFFVAWISSATKVLGIMGVFWVKKQAFRLKVFYCFTMFKNIFLQAFKG